MRTPTQKLADRILGEPVESWITDRRGTGASWRRIALQLRDETSGEIDVTPSTLLSWAPDAVKAVSA